MTALTARRPAPTFRGPFGVSILAHLLLIAGIGFLAKQQTLVLPPVYRVNLLAAPASVRRSVGEVRQTPPQDVTPPPVTTPVPKRAAAPTERTAPTPARSRPIPAATTPVPNAASAKRDAPAPVAGGGPKGGAGADVATVQTEGVVFPYDGYIDNIARQLMLRFEPADKRPLTVIVRFVIHRDGSVKDFSVRKSSGSFGFDNEARGAVEAAGRSRAFGKLPEGFSDDVLPVTFTFAPEFVR